ncbi:hypothetical protein [Sulfitobacter sp. 1A15106]|uniref:hypothetical protein n=1 Tax=Sulfitobacter sp. 1A15106 TaxID=3368590 RepID=UPI003746E781
MSHTMSKTYRIGLLRKRIEEVDEKIAKRESGLIQPVVTDEDDKANKRQLSHIRKLTERRMALLREIYDLACHDITGKGWVDFREGLRAPAAYSIDSTQHSREVIEAFCELFEATYKRRPTIY